MLAVSSHVFAAMDTAFFQVLTSLGLTESRILLAAPADTRPRTSLISFCIVQLRTLCAAHSLATLCLCTTSGPDPGELPGFWDSMVFRHAPNPRKGSGKQQQEVCQLQSCCSIYDITVPVHVLKARNQPRSVLNFSSSQHKKYNATTNSTQAFKF